VSTIPNHIPEEAKAAQAPDAPHGSVLCVARGDASSPGGRTGAYRAECLDLPPRRRAIRGGMATTPHLAVLLGGPRVFTALALHAWLDAGHRVAGVLHAEAEGSWRRDRSPPGCGCGCR
jgi:hypothetical protein